MTLGAIICVVLAFTIGVLAGISIARAFPRKH